MEGLITINELQKFNSITAEDFRNFIKKLFGYSVISSVHLSDSLLIYTYDKDTVLPSKHRFAMDINLIYNRKSSMISVKSEIYLSAYPAVSQGYGKTETNPHLHDDYIKFYDYLYRRVDNLMEKYNKMARRLGFQFQSIVEKDPYRLASPTDGDLSSYADFKFSLVNIVTTEDLKSIFVPLHKEFFNIHNTAPKAVFKGRRYKKI